jgi:nucleotide-binding universal stress UspA family protein
MLSIQTILHPTDFSRSSEQAFRLACALARDHAARLIVLHIARGPGANTAQGGVPLSADEYWDEVGARLHDLQPRDPQLQIEHCLALGNDPATKILQVARQTRADLIVMGTEGRTGLKRVLRGSVAERVMHEAPCPVLTAHDESHLLEEVSPDGLKKAISADGLGHKASVS